MKNKDTKYEHGAILLSSVTGMPYVDESYHSYLFLDEKKAEEYTKNIKNTILDTFSKRSLETEKANCYAVGAMALEVIGDGTQVYALRENQVSRGYYNRGLNKNLVFLKQFHKKRFLNAFLECRFLVPAKIEDNTVLYCTIRKRDQSGYLYLAFSDLREFHSWPKHEEWEPVEIDYTALMYIGRDHGYLINPNGCRLLLTPDDMAMIWEKGNVESKNTGNKKK